MASGYRFFFALFSLFRFSLNLGVLERPLAVGLLWGLLTGHYQLGLGVGLFFELFWLDQIPAGTYIPPNTVFSTLLTLGLADYFLLLQPSELLLPLALSLPMALVGARLEYLQRRWQDAGYNSLLHWMRLADGRRNPRHPERLILTSVLQQLALNLAVFTVGILVLIEVVAVMRPMVGAYLRSFPITWPHLWFVAALGGILALRLNRSYKILACGVVLLTLVLSF